MDIILGLVAQFYPYIAGVLIAVAGVFGIHKMGQQSESKRRDLEEANNRIKSIEEARKTKNEVDKLNSTDLDRELDRFMRD